MKKYPFIRTISCILVMLILVSVLPAVGVVYAGVAYDGFEYWLSNGEVEITGYVGSDTDLVLPSVIEGYPVTRVGLEAFQYNSDIKSVKIPEGIEVDAFAFRGCTNLTHVEMSGIKEIDACVFAECTSLTSFKIPDGVEHIWPSAFSGCIGLTSIIFPDSIKLIDSGAFSDCTGLTSIVFPDSIKLIDSGVFSDCTGLTSVTLPETVTRIEADAFLNCDNIKDVYYDGSASQWEKIDIGEGNSALLNANIHMADSMADSSVFCNFLYEINGDEVKITGIKKPTSVINIPSQIEGLPVTSISSGTFNSSIIEKVIISDSVKRIEDESFCGTNLNSIVISESVEYIGSRAIAENTDIKNIEVDENNKVYDSRDNCNAIVETATNTLVYGGTNTVIPSDIEHIGEFAFYFRDYKGIIPSGIKTIGVYAFSGNSFFKELTLPDSIEEIEGYAFELCHGLTSVVFPEGIKRIGSGAFSGCKNLADIEVPPTVVSLAGNAFVGTAYYENTGNWEDGLLYIDSALVAADIYLKDDYSIKAGTTIIADRVFEDPNEIISINLPDSLVSIGNYAFSGCSELKGISLPDGLENIGNYAFNNCSSIKTIDIPSNVKNIGKYAFQWCGSVTDVTLPLGISSIEEGTFSDCYKLTNISIPKSVTNIGDFAFSYCKSITSLTISENVTHIGAGAFSKCSGLVSIEVDKNNEVYDSRNNCNAIIETNTNALIQGCVDTTIPSDISSIGERAFMYCSGIESITIPKSVTSIGDRAFWGVGNTLTSIKVDEDNEFYDSRQNCNAIIESATNTLILGCNYTEIPQSITRIEDGAFIFCDELKSVVVPEGVTSIGFNAFYDCDNIAAVTLPLSLKSIGEWAFECMRLKDVYYAGSSAEWDQINIDENNYYLDEAQKHYGFKYEVIGPPEEDYVTDEDTGVSVAGADDAELKVSELKNGSGIADVDFVILGMNMFKVYDITLQKDGEEVQPEDMVWVRVPVENPYARIYRMEDNGTFTDMNAEYKDGYLVFVTEHFSLYVVAEPVRPLGDANGDGKVNVRDATEIQKAVAGIITLSQTAAVAADADLNITVNVKDATAVQKLVAGMKIAYPIGQIYNAENTAPEDIVGEWVQYEYDTDYYGKEVLIRNRIIFRDNGTYTFDSFDFVAIGTSASDLGGKIFIEYDGKTWEDQYLFGIDGNYEVDGDILTTMEGIRGPGPTPVTDTRRFVISGDTLVFGGTYGGRVYTRVTD